MPFTRSHAAAFFIASFLGACGGGGGGTDADAGSLPSGRGGTSTPTPPPAAPSAATLDRPRTLDLAGALIAELDLTSKAGVTPANRPYLPTAVARGKAVLANVEEPCPGGGNIEERQNLFADLTGTIDIAFRDCIEGGVRQNGALRIRINEFDKAQNAATDFLLTFEDLAFAVEQSSIVANGTAAVTVRGPVERMALNFAGRYSPENISIRLDNVVVVETTLATPPGAPRHVSISGRLHHSEHGFVDLSTLQELVFTGATAADPASGAVRLTGAQNATVDIGFGGGPLTVSLDADGNGRVDAALATTWLAMHDTQNFAPGANAGADVTIAHGATITADASASADWEGDPLTYQWQLASRPEGSSATASGTSPTLSFTADVAGAYDLEVTVRDARSGSSDTMRVTVLPPGVLPPNLPPIANAGVDQATVEGQSVTIDGSGTTDVESDPITYLWQLVSAPTGSAATVTVTSASFDFTPDVPGTYQLRLTAADRQGNSSDTVRVIADQLLTFVSGVSFRIDAASPAGSDHLELSLRTSPLYRGAPVGITAASDSSWLLASAPGATSAPPGDATVVPLQLDLAAVRALSNGAYRAQVTATSSGGQRAAAADVSLNLQLPVVRAVVPYVAYSGSPSRVTLYGEGLAQANGRSLFIDGVEVLGISATTDDRATIELPPLPVGTYTVRIGHALPVAREMGRVLVRDAPAYGDAQLSLPGLVTSLEYDAERDSFYAVFQDNLGFHVARRLRREGGAWALDLIPVSVPLAVGLTADGTQLLVTSPNCTVHRLDPGTLATLQSLTKPSCDPLGERFGAIAALADGRVLIVDTEQGSNVWEYPGFGSLQILPAIQDPLAVLSYERNRLLWAERPADQGRKDIFYYDVGGPAAQSIQTQGDTLFTYSRLAISGDGSRTLHQARVYDDALRFIGTLEGRSTDTLPGLNRRGTRAIALDLQQNALFVHDVSGGGPTFPQMGGGIALQSYMTLGSKVVVPPTGTAAFVFTVNGWIPGYDPDPFKLYVRVLPQ